MSGTFVFVFPDVAAGLFQGCKPHMGIEYIRAQNPTRCTSSFICDNKATLHEMARSIASLAESGVGFSVYETNFRFVATLAESIRALRPNIPIVCGGPTATFSADSIMKACPAIDVCVIGEGEISFYEALDSLRDRQVLERVHGLVLRSPDGSPQHTPCRRLYKHPRNRAEQLEGIRSPYLVGMADPGDAPSLGVYTSRGCYHACTFCSFSALGGQRLRRFPLSQVNEELKLICQHFARSRQNVLVPINDDYFTADVPRCLSILTAAAIHRPENVHFWIDSRADCKSDATFWKVAAECGVSEVNFGLESASPSVLRLAKKVAGRNDVFLEKELAFIARFKESVCLASEAGIRVSTSVILGLPGDSKDAAVGTLDFLRGLPIAEYAHNRLRLFEGTELSRDHDRFGIRRISSPGSPFPVTMHSYDATSIPYRSNATQVYDFRRGALLRTLCALTGTANSFFRCDSPNLAIRWDDCAPSRSRAGDPSGRAEISVVGRMPDRGIESTTACLHWVVGDATQRLVDPHDIGEESLSPAIRLPGDKCDEVHSRTVIEFFDIQELSDACPGSDEAHWRLPLAACALMPCDCPARRGAVLHADKGDKACAFYENSENILESFPCDTCEVRNLCARCPEMLRRFGVGYCLHQLSGASFDVLAYVLSHLYAALDREVDWKRLPAVERRKSRLDPSGRFIGCAGSRVYTNDGSGSYVVDLQTSSQSDRAQQRLDAILGTRMNER